MHIGGEKDMMDKVRLLSLNPAISSAATQKQHDLKLRKMLAFRAKRRQQRYHNKIQKLKHARAHLHDLLRLKVITSTMKVKPVFKPNIHGLFYVKPVRKTNDPTYGYNLKI